MIYLGIDLHTRNMTLCALTFNNQPIGQWKIPNSLSELDRIIARFNQPVKAVVEATGNWYWLADWAHDRGVELILAHAKMLKAIAYAKVKTDAVDARTLAELLTVDLIPRAHMVMGQQRDLRELLRARLRILWRRTKTQDSIYRLFFKYNVPIPRYAFRDLMYLEGHLHKHTPPPARLEATLQIDQLRLLENQVGVIEGHIDACKRGFPDYERLTAVPGIGMVSAWSILAEVGDISRFPSAKHFVSYCRLVPGAADSGGKRRHKSGCKDGNRYLKIAFSQAAIAAVRFYKPVRDYYNKIRKRSGRHVARTVVAKELARIVYHMLTGNEPFRGFKGIPIPKDTCANWPHPISPAALRGSGPAGDPQPDAH